MTAADNSPQQLASSVTRGFTGCRGRPELIHCSNGKLHQYQHSTMISKEVRSSAIFLARWNVVTQPQTVLSSMPLLPSSHRRHWQHKTVLSCLVGVHGVKWTEDKSRLKILKQFCPVSKCGVKWVLSCPDSVSNAQRGYLLWRHIWKLGQD